MPPKAAFGSRSDNNCVAVPALIIRSTKETFVDYRYFLTVGLIDKDSRTGPMSQLGCFPPHRGTFGGGEAWKLVT